MTNAQANALIATSYNLHVGRKIKGEFMTPSEAAKLKRADKAALAFMLREKGGSDLYTTEQANEAFVKLVGQS